MFNTMAKRMQRCCWTMLKTMFDENQTSFNTEPAERVFKQEQVKARERAGVRQLGGGVDVAMVLERKFLT